MCPICDTAHFNEWEHMRVCIKCYREHELDLGFMEFLMDNADHVQEAVKAMMEKSFEDVDKTIEAYNKKMKRYRRMLWVFVGFQVLMAIMYITVVFVKPWEQ